MALEDSYPSPIWHLFTLSYLKEVLNYYCQARKIVALEFSQIFHEPIHVYDGDVHRANGDGCVYPSCAHASGCDSQAIY